MEVFFLPFYFVRHVSGVADGTGGSGKYNIVHLLPILETLLKFVAIRQYGYG